jgi:peptidoglycan/LPS O-acetylase OafA/YrhL
LGAEQGADGAPGQTPYFLGLDVIRLCAAAFVMFYHLGFSYFVNQDNAMARAVDTSAILPFTGWWSSSGWVGVEVFFVLSGVVISGSAEGKTWGRFLTGRLLRLYPAVWICASVSLLAATVSAMRAPESLVGPYLRGVMLTPYGKWIEGSFWTLPIEMSFYLFVGALLMSNAGKYAFDGINVIGVASAAYWIVWQVCLHAGNGLSWIHRLGDTLTISIYWRSLDLTLIHHGCFFALGALMYRSCVLRAPSRWTMAAPILMGGCWLEIAIVNRMRVLESGYEMNALIPVAAWTAAIVLMLLSIAYWRQIAHFCGPALASWVRFGGLMTYPLYLCHFSVSFAVVKGLRGLGAPPMAAWVGGTAVAVLVAAFVAASLEPRLRRATAQGLDRLAASLARLARRPAAHVKGS